MRVDVPVRKAAAVVLAGLAISALAAATKSSHPTPPVHLSQKDLKWVPLPEFGGQEAIIHRSPDGRRVAAAFRESGRSTFTYSFDEFLIVTSGSLTVHVHGGETFTLSKGDLGYFTQGTVVDFDFSKDFSDITCLMGDQPVRWR
jgi:uncharacterized cupin superfamily protein